MTLVLLVLPLAGLAQDAIHGVRVIAESAGEVTLEVDCSYSGSLGPTAFVQAFAQAGDALSKTGYRAGVVQPGRHVTQVGLVAPADDDWYVTSEVEVRLYRGTSSPIASKRFAFAKTWSRPTASMPLALRVLGPMPPPAPGGQGASGALERRFAADGAVEIVYPDGSVKRMYRGGFTLVGPDGKEQRYSFSTLQAPTPPLAPPDDGHARWLAFETDRLLGIIRSLVGQNEPTVANYLAREAADLSPYGRISARREAIERMVTP
jgi:hypothetical protein